MKKQIQRGSVFKTHTLVSGRVGLEPTKSGCRIQTFNHGATVTKDVLENLQSILKAQKKAKELSNSLLSH